jgi:glycosyltransferase involved in cell wall biosynthesis
MEAMAFKVPVIATRITGIPKLIEDSESGFLVETTDLEGLVEKIEQLLKDEPLRARFTAKGCQKVTEEFNLEREVNKLIAVWKA